MRQGTLLRYIVECSVGLSPFGKLADHAVVWLLLRHMFDYRHSAAAPLLSCSKE